MVPGTYVYPTCYICTAEYGTWQVAVILLKLTIYYEIKIAKLLVSAKLLKLAGSLAPVLV